MTQELVRRRAQERCEYCGIHQIHVATRFHVEHIIAKQHDGTDDPSNLALACDRCNAFKIIGKSEMGRATVRLLNMNAYHRVQLRTETGE